VHDLDLHLFSRLFHSMPQRLVLSEIVAIRRFHSLRPGRVHNPFAFPAKESPVPSA
jgi:hypothetical protein